MKSIFNNKAQSIMEYAIIMGLVVAALTTMQVYIKRGIQAGIKVAADEIGRQQDAEEIDPLKGTKMDSIIRRVTSGAAEDIKGTIEGEEKVVLPQGATQRIRLSEDGSQRTDIYIISEVKPINEEGKLSYSTYTSEREK